MHCMVVHCFVVVGEVQKMSWLVEAMMSGATLPLTPDCYGRIIVG